MQTALSTFSKLCQDVPKALERVQSAPGRPFLDYLVPALIGQLESDNPKIRSHALNCLIPFIEPETDGTPPNSVSRCIDVFLSALFKRASDPSAAVRKQVCTAMVALLSSRPQKIIPEINGVVDYVLHCTQDEDKELALEACEFWLTFAEDQELLATLHPFLPRVAPVLFDCTVYSEDELFSLGALDDENDAAVPDKPEDIRPQFYGNKAHSQSTQSDQPHASGSGANNAGGSGRSRGLLTGDGDAANEDDLEEEDDLEDEEDSDDEDYSEWTLRKCAAAALDVMANAFETELMHILLPHLKTKLYSEDWLQRESGILTLGAMAEGCIGHLSEHLPVLIPYLLTTLNDSRPLIRSIACWTLGRYSTWLIAPDSSLEHKQAYFVPALEGLLRMLLDNNKKVQEAGCSAFATLEEEAAFQLEPYLEPVLRNLVSAFQKYQQKNTLILYDAIGTLADSVGDALNKKELIDILMPPLILKWQKLGDDDEDLVPLLECMSSIVIAVGSGFITYAQPVFERCVRIVHQNLVHFQTHQQNPTAYDPPDKSFLITALDLLSGLTQGLNTAITPLYEATGNQIFQLTIFCMQYPEPPVRQSAYALLGDCAISIFPLIKQELPTIMPLLTAQIEVEPKAEMVSVCNNAAWAAGEIALKLGTETQPYVNELVQKLIPTLMSAKAARSLAENAAVTIGRLGLVCPQMVAPHLDLFIRHWCTSLAEIKDNDEKDSAFRGICMVIQHNPAGLSKVGCVPASSRTQF